jgi:predicted HTH transcriptional regulator
MESIKNMEQTIFEIMMESGDLSAEEVENTIAYMSTKDMEEYLASVTDSM